MPPTDAELIQSVTTARPNPRNDPTMFKIFQNVQYNVVQHKKYVKEMTKLYKKVNVNKILRNSSNINIQMTTCIFSFLVKVNLCNIICKIQSNIILQNNELKSLSIHSVSNSICQMILLILQLPILESIKHTVIIL